MEPLRVDRRFADMSRADLLTLARRLKCPGHLPSRTWNELSWLVEDAEARGLVVQPAEVPEPDMLADVARLRQLVDYLPTGMTGEAVNLINRIEYRLKGGAR